MVTHKISRIFINFYFNSVIKIYYYFYKAHLINKSNKIKAEEAIFLN